MRIAIRDHHGKSLTLARALQRAGHELVADISADVLLIDFDIRGPQFDYERTIDRFKSAGAKVLLYPHAAWPQLCYDGMIEPHPDVDGNLVFAPGHAEVMRRIDYPAPTYVMGWSLSELAPLRTTADVRRVLFAPAHPTGDGRQYSDEHYANVRAYQQLLDAGVELTVRHVGPLELSGLWDAPGVRFVQGDYSISHAEIDDADVVVSAPGTFLTLSVARGAPTVTYYQDQEAGVGGENDSPVSISSVRRSHLYKDYFRFPFDLGDGPTDDVLHAAAGGQAELGIWRRRFVGDAFDQAAFAGPIIHAAAQPVSPSLGETRGETVAAFADEVVERPELLAEFAGRFGPDDDATLLLYAPGWTPDALLAGAERAVEEAGLGDRVPDILLAALAGSPVADREIAARASSVLSDWPTVGPIGRLPRFGTTPALRIAA